MKNIKIVTLTACMALMLSLMLFSSCSNDDSSSSSGAAAPVIESVMRTGYDEDGVVLPLEPVNFGIPKNYYIIHGSGLLSTQKVYFNDYDTYFRPTYVTDTDIIILIDTNTPYANSSNKIKLVTNNGTVLYDFLIAPPAPVLDWFNPMNGAAGDEITISGNYFLNPIVTLAATPTLPAVPVTVVSSTLTSIKIKIPANANNRNISVANLSGTATSVAAIGSSIYDDKFYSACSQGGWGIANVNLANTTASEIAQGVKAIKYDINAWSGLQLDFSNAIPVPTGAIGLRFQMKVSTPCAIGIIINGGNWGNTGDPAGPAPFSLNNKFSEYVVKWADLGLTAAPASITSIVFFNNGTASTQYVDDIGFKF
jgi:hypothetical protein